MTTYVAFLRAINVGGRVVRMTQLCTFCESIALRNVRTFIASGNVIFESAKHPADVESAIERKLQTELGYEVATMVRSLDDLSHIAGYVDETGIGSNDQARLYVGFLKSAPTRAAAAKVSALSTDVDQLTVRGRELYWRCAASFSDSPLDGARLEKLLSIAATLRNFNTVQRILAKYR